jgi:hypothetical protein
LQTRVRRQFCKIWKGEIAEFLGVGFAKFEVAGSSYHFLGKGREMLCLFGGRFELLAHVRGVLGVRGAHLDKLTRYAFSHGT